MFLFASYLFLLQLLIVLQKSFISQQSYLSLVYKKSKSLFIEVDEIVSLINTLVPLRATALLKSRHY